MAAFLGRQYKGILGTGSALGQEGIILPSAAAPAPSYDPDAVAYFTAAGITDTAEKDAVNQLVLNLKGTGSTPSGTDLWTDAAAFYPISPTSLAASAYNLRDTTSLNMTWANSPTHASTGVTFDGATQYGDTGFNPSTASLANGYDITLGVQIVNASVTALRLMSAVVSTGSRTQMLLNSGNIYQDIHNTTGGRLVTSAGGTYQGRMIVSADRIANGGRANYLNATSLGTKLSESSGTPVNLTLWTGAENNGSGGSNFSAFELAFGLIIPKGLNATAVADLDDAIVRYSTALSRDNDPLTDAMIAATGETDETQIAAYNILAERLRGTGTTNGTDFITDNLIHAFNPISSTSLAAAAYNFIDPSTFQATWYNNPTHSSAGVTGNGTTMYGDTNFNPNTSAALDDFGLTMYISNDVAVNGVDMGVRVAATSFVQLNSYFSGTAQGVVNTNAVGYTQASNANSIGVYTAVRRTSTDTELYKDGVSIDTKVDTSVSLPNGNIYVLGRNLIGTGAEQFTTRRLSTYVIHKGLTDNQAADLYDAITDYRTALNDALTTAMIAATGETDATQIAAYNTLAERLRGTGTTNGTDFIGGSLLTAVYPISSVSLAAAAYNFIDPSTHQITWFNSPTHASTGITGNGTTQYGNTGYNHITEGASINDMGFTYSGVYSDGDRAMGAVNTGLSPVSYLEIANANSVRKIYAGENGNQANFGATARGVSTGVRSAADYRVGYFNGTAGTPNTTADTAAFPNLDIFLLSRNVNGSAAAFFAGEVDFYALHNALTANQVTDLYEAITDYNTALNR